MNPLEKNNQAVIQKVLPNKLKNEGKANKAYPSQENLM